MSIQSGFRKKKKFIALQTENKTIGAERRFRATMPDDSILVARKCCYQKPPTPKSGYFNARILLKIALVLWCNKISILLRSPTNANLLISLHNIILFCWIYVEKDWYVHECLWGMLKRYGNKLLIFFLYFILWKDMVYLVNLKNFNEHLLRAISSTIWMSAYSLVQPEKL